MKSEDAEFDKQYKYLEDAVMLGDMEESEASENFPNFLKNQILILSFCLEILLMVRWARY